jgi:hypothetical protein
LAFILSKSEGGRKLGRSLPNEHIPEIAKSGPHRNRASIKAWPDQTETIRALIFRKRYAVLLLLLEMRDHFIPIFLKVFKPGRIDEIDLNASDLDHP